MKLDDLIAGLNPADHEKLLQQVQEYKDALDREKCQESFMAYVKKMWPGFIHGRHHALMAKKFEEIAEGKLKRLCISLPPRHAIMTSMKIPTLAGMKTMADLQVGDYVFGPDGKPTLVLGKSEVFINRQLYKVTTDDGFSLVVDGEHLWTASLDRKIRKFFDYTTEQLWERQNGVMYRATSKTKVIQKQNKICDPSKVRMPMLPRMAAVERPEANLLVDPYVLGVWLGDGSKHQEIITCADDDAAFVRPEIERRGYTTTDQSTRYTFGILGLKVKLRELGVLENKHIPKQYLAASIQQRRDLLKGLMDTDGCVSKAGQCYWMQSNKALIDQVRVLLASLGIKNSVIASEAKIGDKSYGDTWRITFYAHDVCHLPRKEERARLAKGDRFGRYIKVEKLDQAGDTQCIKVDREDGLFMAGEGHIITHNTKSEFGSFLFPSWYLGKFPNKKVMQASNTGELAVGFGRKVRNLVMSDQYANIFPGVSLRQDSKAAGRWSTNKEGEYFAIGVGGTMTGRGADLCVRPWSKVVTNRGTVRADEVAIDDKLLGQEGFANIHHIIHSWHNSTVRINELEVSANHPVLIAGKGFVEAEQVSVGDKLISLSALYKIWIIYHQWVNHGLPRTKLFAGVRHLGQYASALWESKSRKLHDVWRSWNQSVRSLEVVSQLFRGHWAGAFSGAYAGQDRLEWKLRAGKCALGKHRNSAEQQVKHDLDRGIWSNTEHCSVGQKDRPVSGSDQTSHFCDGHGARASDGSAAHELAAKTSHSDGLGWQRDSQIQQLRGSKEKVWWRKCLERIVRSCKDSLWIQVEVRRVEKTSHPPELFINFHVSKNNTFVCESYITHNCIIDDPHTEGEAALASFQPEIYDKSYEWYTSGPRQRLQPNGAIVLIATRWSKRDLIGRVLKAAGELGKEDEWEVIELPAIMPSGKPLWPEFWSLGELTALKDELPPAKWNSQYQQKPTAEEGAIVKREWWKIWERDDPPPCEFIIQSWDTAFTKGERNDYSACTTWGVFCMNEDETDVNVILLDSFQKRMEFPELKEKARAHYIEWEPDAFIVEAKAAGAPLIFELRAQGIPVSEYTPSRGNDKFVRMNSVADLFQSGKVWAPDTRWARELIENMAAFPNAEHDDLSDSACQALIRFRQGGFLRLQTDEKEETRSFKRKAAFY